MDKNKFSNFNSAFRRLPLEMALHPFLTFLAGLALALAVAAFFLVTIANLIESDSAAAPENAIIAKKFDSKNCQNIFAEWDRQQKTAEDFLKSDIYNPFFTAPEAFEIDQTQE